MQLDIGKYRIRSTPDCWKVGRLQKSEKTGLVYTNDHTYHSDPYGLCKAMGEVQARMIRTSKAKGLKDMVAAVEEVNRIFRLKFDQLKVEYYQVGGHLSVDIKDMQRKLNAIPKPRVRRIKAKKTKAKA